MNEAGDQTGSLSSGSAPWQVGSLFRYSMTIWFVLSIAVTTALSLYALEANRKLADSIGAGGADYRAIANAANEAASYVKRAETHLFIHLMLNTERDRRVYPGRVKSLREQWEIMDGKAVNPAARVLVEKMKVGIEEVERLGISILERHDQNVKKGIGFQASSLQDMVVDYNRKAAVVRSLSLQLAALELDLHNDNIQAAAKRATELRTLTLVLVSCGSLFVLFYGLVMALLARRLRSEVAERARTENELRRSQAKLETSREELRLHRDSLEELVGQRTQELQRTVLLLREEAAQRERTQAALLRAKESAEQANQAKTDFLANMSHEFRTPLTHILGFADVLRAGLAGPLTQQQKEFLGFVISSSNHLHTLVNDLLDMAKVEAGRLDLNLEPVSLEKLLVEAFNAHSLKAREARVSLDSSLRDLPVGMELDAGKITQVINNLLANAIKFSPGGWVNLEAWGRPQGWPQSSLGRDKPHVEIVVSDSGIGIEVKDLQRIFRPFEQVDSSTSRQFDGSGLGLALARNLVQMHGGHLWAESRGLGQGSQFHLVLPWAGAPSGGSDKT